MKLLQNLTLSALIVSLQLAAPKAGATELPIAVDVQEKLAVCSVDYLSREHLELVRNQVLKSGLSANSLDEARKQMWISLLGGAAFEALNPKLLGSNEFTQKYIEKILNDRKAKDYDSARIATGCAKLFAQYLAKLHGLSAEQALTIELNAYARWGKIINFALATRSQSS